MERELISIEEAGRRWFGVSHNTARKLAREGTIPTIRVGRNSKVDVAEMEKRYRELANGSVTPKEHIAELVAANISVIEFALLWLANSKNISHYTRVHPEAVARLANSLREACECAS